MNDFYGEDNVMSLNRTLRDFIVKGVKIKVRSGSSWVSPSPAIPKAGEKYRLEVLCGNASGRISWGNEGDYNKVMLQIKVVAKGFRNVQQDKIEFYRDSSFSRKILGNTKYRTSFELPEYKPTHADSVTHLYLMFKPGVVQYPLYWLQWDVGVYGAVRNHHWKTRGGTST